MLSKKAFCMWKHTCIHATSSSWTFPYLGWELRSNFWWEFCSSNLYAPDYFPFESVGTFPLASIVTCFSFGLGELVFYCQVSSRAVTELLGYRRKWREKSHVKKKYIWTAMVLVEYTLEYFFTLLALLSQFLNWAQVVCWSFYSNPDMVSLWEEDRLHLWGSADLVHHGAKLQNYLGPFI